MKYQVRRRDTWQSGLRDAPAFIWHKELDSSDCTFDTMERAQALADELREKNTRHIEGVAVKYYVNEIKG